VLVTNHRTILFLCTGNFYRSRFAEVLFNAVAAQASLAWRAESRGLAVEWGWANVGPMSRSAVERLDRLGIRCHSCLRFPLAVVEDDLRRADLVVAIKEAEHRPLLQQKHPSWADRVEYWHVHDLDCAPADQALAVLEHEVRAVAARLAAGLPRPDRSGASVPAARG
jgi:protein-tyrosine-phosphatase